MIKERSTVESGGHAKYSRGTISSELLVGVEILAMSQAGEPSTFTDLVERLRDDRPRRVVSRAVDVLFDQGQIEAEWKKRPNGMWARHLVVYRSAVPFFETVAASLGEGAQ